jgi:hypothetical protein
MDTANYRNFQAGDSARQKKSKKIERAGVVSPITVHYTGVCARVEDLDLFSEKMKNQNPDTDAGCRISIF